MKTSKDQIKKKSKKNKAKKGVKTTHPKKAVAQKPKPLSAIKADNLDADSTKKIALGLLVLSFLVYVGWALLSKGTWDDDCVGRYFNTLNAFNNPSEFIGMWNRPLWVTIFAIPVQVSYLAVPILMTAFGLVAGYSLFLSMKMRNISYPFLIILFLLFQPYYLGTGNDAMTEPLAAAIICISYYMLLQKKWLPFVLLGALLPLARAELLTHLLFWFIPLVVHKQYKLIPLLGAGVAVWALAAGIITGDWLYLYNETIGNEISENRYGSQPVNTYISRYFYVIGPVVFFFLIMGFVRAIHERKASLFIEGQFLFGFTLYTLFASKIVLGQSAGFLRNLIPLSPFAAVIAMQGFDYWLRRFFDKKQFITILSAITIAILTGLFFRYTLKVHHKISTDIGHFQLGVVGVLLLATLVPWKRLVKTKSVSIPKITAGLAILAGALSVAFATISEPPDANMSSERGMISKAVNYYKAVGLDQAPRTFCSHDWFFWAGNLDRNKGIYGKTKKDTLKAAPAGSFVLWEKHYSNRLGNDTPVSYMVDRKNGFVKIATIHADDYTRNCFLFVKREGNKTDMEYLDDLIAKNDNYAYPYLIKAELAINSKKSQEAESYLKTALQKDSAEIYAKFLLAKVAAQKGQHAEAVKILDEIKPKYQNWMNWYLDRGSAAFNLEKFAEAAKIFEEGIEKKKDMGALYHNLGVCLIRQNKNAEACVQLKKAISYKYTESQKLVDQYCK